MHRHRRGARRGRDLRGRPPGQREHGGREQAAEQCRRRHPTRRHAAGDDGGERDEPHPPRPHPTPAPPDLHPRYGWRYRISWTICTATRSSWVPGRIGTEACAASLSCGVGIRRVGGYLGDRADRAEGHTGRVCQLPGLFLGLAHRVGAGFGPRCAVVGDGERELLHADGVAGRGARGVDHRAGPPDVAQGGGEQVAHLVAGDAAAVRVLGGGDRQLTGPQVSLRHPGGAQRVDGRGGQPAVGVQRLLRGPPAGLHPDLDRERVGLAGHGADAAGGDAGRLGRSRRGAAAAVQPVSTNGTNSTAATGRMSRMWSSDRRGPHPRRNEGAFGLQERHCRADQLLDSAVRAMGDGDQDRLTISPSASRSIECAAGCAPRPGMVRMSPQIG